MEKKLLGNTDMRITRIGFGAWAIGGGDWAFVPGGEVGAVAWAPSGKVLVTGSFDKTLRTWRWPDLSAGPALARRVGEIRAATPLAGGRALALAGSDGVVRLWDLATGRQTQALSGPGDAIEALAAAADGRSLIAASRDRSAWVWHLSTGKARQLEGHRGPVYAAAISADGRLAATGSVDAIRLWSLDSDAAPRLLIGHERSIRGLAFSPDGRTLASAGYDASVRLWDVARGDAITRLEGHTKVVNGVRYSPDGRWLVSWSDDATLRLWEVAGRRAVATLAGHDAPVRDARFSPDGRTLYSTGQDGAVLVWDVDGKQVKARLKPGLGPLAALVASDTLLVAGGEAGVAQIWRRRDNVEALRLYGFAAGDWAAIAPDGSFDGSPEGFQYLNVRTGAEVNSLDQYAERYFNPGRVQASLAVTPAAAVAPPAPTRRIEQERPAPRVTFLDPPERSDVESVTLRVQIEDQGGGIGEVRLTLNGAVVVMNASRGLQLKVNQNAAYTYEVRLAPGPNTLRAIAFNADGSVQSRAAETRIVDDFIVIKRPSLYAVVIGIDSFLNPALRLNYSVADADLFADVLGERARSLFSGIHVTRLTRPADTTREAIVATLTRFRRDIGPNDLFVFYVASHGTLDGDDYFLLTSNVGSTATARLHSDAIDQTQLKTLLGNIAATKKLIVLDTCHAGKLADAGGGFATRGLGEDRAIKILSRSVGMTTLYAATDTQRAIEGYKGHGLFTWVVVQGLLGQADADRDGYVKTLELANYVDSQVPEIAERVFGQRQYPIVAPTGMGFPITQAP
jgi:WD40 repeat protein